MVLVFVPTFNNSPSFIIIESFGIMQERDPIFFWVGEHDGTIKSFFFLLFLVV